MFAYCRNNPVNHADPNGDWILDAIFLIADLGDAIAHPSVKAFGWVLLDVACFADPTGAGATAAHTVKAARAMEIKNRKRKTIRVPNGYEMAHRRGFEARKGYGYSHSDLQVIKNHRTQHKIDNYGKGR